RYTNISYSSVLDSDLPRERPLLETRNQSIPPLPPWSGHPKAFISRSGVRPTATALTLRLRFEQEAKLLKKSVAQVARRDQRIQARENEIKNLEALLEAETDMKKTTEAKNAELVKELENLRALFSDLQVSNDRLSQQVSTLQAQVTGEEKLKAAFEEFKQYEDNRVEKRYAEMDARLDALSIDFDEELYPRMLTVIASCRLVIGHRLRLEVMKCGESTELRQVFADVVSAGIAKGMSEGIKYGVEHGKANLGLEAIEAYDRMPILIMLRIHVYPEVRDPKDPWAAKEEMLLADAIAANTLLHKTETSEDGASPRICNGSVSCAPWESSRMHITS
nr:hypothetical protein [Tanacetum cinerariifolium]